MLIQADIVIAWMINSGLSYNDVWKIRLDIVESSRINSTQYVLN